MSKVFVSQQTLRRSRGTGEMIQFPSLNPAQEFGEVVVLLDWYAEKDMTDDQVIWEMRRKLAGYSDSDYLLPLGSVRSIAASIMVAGEVTDGRVKLLEWERDLSRYNVRVMDMNTQPLNRIGEMR